MSWFLNRNYGKIVEIREEIRVAAIHTKDRHSYELSMEKTCIACPPLSGHSQSLAVICQQFESLQVLSLPEKGIGLNELGELLHFKIPTLDMSRSLFLGSIVNGHMEVGVKIGNFQ